jgi:hypothetical protein
MCMLQKGSSGSCMLKWDNKLCEIARAFMGHHIISKWVETICMQQGKNRDKHNYSFGFWEQFAIWSHELDFQSH